MREVINYRPEKGRLAGKRSNAKARYERGCVTRDYTPELYAETTTFTVEAARRAKENNDPEVRQKWAGTSVEEVVPAWMPDTLGPTRSRLHRLS